MLQNEGWEEYKLLVISELERANTKLEVLDDKLNKANQEIATLKVKASIWGLAGGMIPAIVALLYFILGTGG